MRTVPTSRHEEVDTKKMAMTLGIKQAEIKKALGLRLTPKGSDLDEALANYAILISEEEHAKDKAKIIKACNTINDFKKVNKTLPHNPIMKDLFPKWLKLCESLCESEELLDAMKTLNHNSFGMEKEELKAFRKALKLCSSVKDAKRLSGKAPGGFFFSFIRGKVRASDVAYSLWVKLSKEEIGKAVTLAEAKKKYTKKLQLITG